MVSLVVFESREGCVQTPRVHQGEPAKERMQFWAREFAGAMK